MSRLPLLSRAARLAGGTLRARAADRTPRPAWSAGSWDDPVPIASSGDARLVACTGRAAPDAAPHPTTWLTVQKGAPCQCPCCRQVFRLQLRGEE